MKYTSLLLIGISLLSLTACGPGAVISAGSTVGVVAAQERTVGRAVDDLTIKTAIISRYAQKDVNDLLVNVDVELSEGRVLLTGDVNKQETAIEAVKLAWQVEGVKEVLNELKINDKGDWQKWVTDVWITQQVRARLLLEKNVRSINYTIETVHGTVYIMGIAQSQEEVNKVTYIASTTRYVKEVVSHVRLKDDPRRDAVKGL
jgi:osmotically-inducible protein OsmY